jgi:copper transport outer membrane protein MctB
MAEARAVISWRYHLVSIVAVILAVALGVLAGATVVGDRFVKQLQTNTTNAERLAEQYRVEADRLRGAINAAAPYLTQDRLLGRDVVLVTQDPVDDVALNELQDALVRQAGARIVALLTATPKIASPDARAQLAGVLSRSSADLPRPGTALAVALARRLAFGPPTRGGADLLDRVGGFVDVEHPSADVQDVGGAGTLVVVFAGGTTDPSMSPNAFLLPFVRELATSPHVTPVAVGESLTSVWGFVGDVRADGDHIPDGSIVTVDDLDQPYGGIAVVLGLADLTSSTGGGGGDYGVTGADGFLPAPPASPSPTPSPVG